MFRAQSEGSRVQSERFRAQSEGFRAQSERFRAQSEVFRAQSERFRAQSERFRAQSERSRAQSERFRAQSEGSAPKARGTAPKARGSASKGWFYIRNEGYAFKRRIKKYSHGMRQRLAIAQAMLGLPELLVLDEPTDGLDPPQIAEMRRVLERYATDGRAVLVSSHLLAEVEQTCTHVVVVNKGGIVAAGLVDEIVGESPRIVFKVSDLAAAPGVLSRSEGRQGGRRDGAAGIVVDTNGTPRAGPGGALVRAGVGVDRVVPRRALEDAFLALVGGDTRRAGAVMTTPATAGRAARVPAGDPAVRGGVPPAGRRGGVPSRRSGSWCCCR